MVSILCRKLRIHESIWSHMTCSESHEEMHRNSNGFGGGGVRLGDWRWVGPDLLILLFLSHHLVANMATSRQLKVIYNNNKIQ